jgi:hypothetical protein
VAEALGNVHEFLGFANPSYPSIGFKSRPSMMTTKSALDSSWNKVWVPDISGIDVNIIQVLCFSSPIEATLLGH